MFSHLSRNRTVSPARRKRRPSLETLEGRQLMSVGPEFISPINTTTRNTQSEPDSATSSNGSSVVVWTDQFSSTDHDIRAQRFNSFGGKTGSEIVVSFSSLDEGSPAVAMDSLGDFEVTWTQHLPGGDSNVVAQRFNPNGQAVGALVQVGAGTFRESDPDVAMDRSGNFVVSYTRETNNNNPDIFAKQYNSAGQLLNVINVSTTSRAETHSSVAMSPDGRFDVAWEDAFSSSDHDIKLNRYAANGTALGVYGIALSLATERSPSVSMDDFGNAVVGWEKASDIKARRVSSSGVVGPEINISSSSDLEGDVSVALKPGGGGFVVAYDAAPLSNLLFRGKVAEVSPLDRVTTFDTGIGDSPTVSFDHFDDYLLAYESGGDIRGRRGFQVF